MQVVDEICQILTDKQFKGKMVVILAGYEHQVEQLLAVNPGLKSRFSERLVFPDFSAEDAVQLLRQDLERTSGLELSTEAMQQLPDLMQQASWVMHCWTAFQLNSMMCTRQHACSNSSKGAQRSAQCTMQSYTHKCVPYGTDC